MYLLRTAFSSHQELLFEPISKLIRKCNGPIIARALARENASEQVTAGCLLIGSEKCAKIFSQSRSKVLETKAVSKLLTMLD